MGGVFALLMLVVPGTTEANRYGPPPPPNSKGVKLLALTWLLVPILGILAAIALPQYQQYLERAAQTQMEMPEAAEPQDY
ncbi:putative major pilin subunit [compost metagenome]